jgi:hypothetical protein
MAYIGKSPTGSAVRSRYYYTATGGETSLSGADDNGKTLKFTDGEYVDVHLNGVMLVQGTDYGVGTANTISSLAALAANDIVEIVVYDVYNVAKINSEAMRNRWYFTATGGETSIGTSQISNLVFPANAEIDVKLNGVTLQAGTDYNTTTANTVGGLSALTAGQVVEIVYYEKFVLADTVSKASGGNFAGGINVDGNLGVGTTTPSQPLHVKGGAVRFENTQDTYLQVNTTDTHLYTAGSHALRLGTNSTERMRIDSSGNVGLGITSPVSNIHIDGSSAGQADLRFTDTATGETSTDGFVLGLDSSTDAYVWNYENDAMYFGTNNDEKMRIDSTGHVLIGASSTIGSSGNTTRGVQLRENYVWIANDDATYLQRPGGADGNFLRFYKSSSQVGRIRVSGQTTAYDTTSDYRVKENVADMSGAITRVKSLKPKRFNFIEDDTDTLVDGFLAHEAQSVVPEAVGGTHNEVETWTQEEIDAGDAPANTSAGDNKLDGDGNTIPVYQSIDQAKLVPLLTGALKEAITKIETLETEMTALKARVTTLENA